MTHVSRIMLVLVLIVAGAAEPRGKLLIMGGAIGANSPAIYAEMSRAVPSGGTIGIVPTASGAPEESAASAIKKVTSFADGRKVVLIPLEHGDVAKADDPAIARQIEQCDAVFFLGGDQSCIVDVFRPGGRRTKASDALDEVLARDGLVAGSSAGAAIMSDPMLVGGTSSGALSPRGRAATRPVPLGPGMGYFPYGLVDQHFLERGRLGRLVVALEVTDKRLGFGIPEDRAIVVDRQTHRISPVGTNGLVLIDRSKAETHKGESGTARRNIRVSLLSTGDAVDARTGEVTVAADRPAATRRVRNGSPAPTTNPWARRRVANMIRLLATTDAESVFSADDQVELRLTADADTTFHISPAAPDVITAINVRLDLLPR